MQEAKIITNWCLWVFGAISFIGWAGAGIAYHRAKYFWYDLFSWALYIAFAIFLIALFVRFILFLITGG